MLWFDEPWLISKKVLTPLDRQDKELCAVFLSASEEQEGGKIEI